MGRPGRWLAAVGAAALVVLGGASPAAADPPGPTDYRSVVTSVDPPAPGVALDVIGGDSFLQLHLTGDEPVEVLGYGGEPYLRFLPDGTVEENQRSPARVLNQDRYGGVELPPGVDAEAEPEWEEVASSGRYAWHDHRTHWMNQARPPGREPGDRILEAVVPLRVGDRDVDVTVASTWVPAPSPVPAVVGGLVGLAGAVWLCVRRRRLATVAGAALAGGVVALALGVWATLSVPAETGPSLLLWALPAVGVVAAGGALAARGLQPPVRAGLVAVAAVELVWWAWHRHEAVVRALVPTDAPLPLDRAVVVGVGVLGVGVLVAAGRLVGATWPGRAPAAEAG